MPKRISVRVPARDDIKLDVTPTVLMVWGQFGEYAEEIEVTHSLDGTWSVNGLTFNDRDEATEHAVQFVCRSIAEQVAQDKLQAALA